MRFVLPLLFLASPSLAQEAAGQGPTEPTSSVPSDDDTEQTPSGNEPSGNQPSGNEPSANQPSAPPRVRRRPDAKKHSAPKRDDESFFQVVIGLGGSSYQDTTSGGNLPADAEGQGFGGAALLAAGLRIVPGMVFGVAAAAGEIIKPKYTIGDQETEAENNLIYSLAGLYIDLNLDPEGSLHMLFIGGVAQLDTQSDSETDDPQGAGGALGLGYRFRVDDDWSLGLTALVYALSTTREDATTLSIIPTGMVGLTWD